jgi:hypothetical protein
MRFIKVTSIKDKKPIYINPDFIGHMYRVPEKKMYGTVEEIGHTVIGTTTHNNGGFKVIEDIDEIFKNDCSF